MKFNPKDFGKVVVLMGGNSAEREVSLVTGENIVNSLQRSGVQAVGLDVQFDVIEKLIDLRPDYAFIALHGVGGEDGSIQGVLQYLGIPYTGSDIIASAVTMNKSLTKLLWQRVGIPTLTFRLVTDIEGAIEAMRDIGFPLCVKPCSDGSSKGVSKVTEPEHLPDAFEKASAFDNKVLIEPWIEGVEYTVGILGNQVLPVIEIRTPHTFYDYAAKYQEDTTSYLCPTSLPPEKEQEIKELAFQAFKVPGCSGWGRVDLMGDSQGNFWFLEINTVPGMTDHSLVPKAAAAVGISFDALVLEILGYAKEREQVVESILAGTPQPAAPSINNTHRQID